jgi:hypothetical protein
MAVFLEVLADTGLVTEACRVAGMSREGAYPARRRDPVFDAAWRAAQAKARPVVADGVIERSITGTVEQHYRDGVLVGERRHYESWLALAVLKRLDKQAREDRDEGSLAARMAGDWDAMLDALRRGGTAAVVPALEVDEVDIPPPPGCDPLDNVWQNESGEWLTAFPPPPGFAGYESAEWDGMRAYTRACTPEESALLDDWHAAVEAEEHAELAAYAEGQRDSFFATLQEELSASSIPATTDDPR